MFGGRSFKIATVAGIQIRLDVSWLVIAALTTYTLYASYTRRYDLPDAESLGFALLSAVLFFGSILVHEGAHAVAGRALGLPVRSITLIFWGGYTEVQADRRGARGEFIVSIVGPLSSLVLGGAFKLLEIAASDPVWNGLFGYLAYINTIVAVLNALPGVPLDGGRVLQAAVWGITGRRETGERVAGVSGILVGWALIAGAIWMATRGALGFTIFLGFIGWTMVASGRGSQERTRVRSELANGRARDAMRAPPATVPADLSLSEALDRYLRGHEKENFPVVDGTGRAVGVISFDTARRVGARDPLRPVRDGMEPLANVPVVSADEPLDRVLVSLGPGRTGLVMEGERMLGTIGPDDISEWFEKRRGAIPAPPTGVGPIPPGPSAPPRPDA
ncbi:MAG: site-2 protease family protein [Actinomycetota bacterium]